MDELLTMHKYCEIVLIFSFSKCLYTVQTLCNDTEGTVDFVAL